MLIHKQLYLDSNCQAKDSRICFNRSSLTIYTIKTKIWLWACCTNQPFGSVGAATALVDWVVAEDSVLPKVSAILWPAHMAFSVWKTACGATFIFSRSTMILVVMRTGSWDENKANQQQSWHQPLDMDYRYCLHGLWQFQCLTNVNVF